MCGKPAKGNWNKVLKFTVLGGSGFIGSHMATYLRSLGHSVIVPTRSESLVHACNGRNVIYAIGLTADFRKRPYDTIEAHVSLVAELLKVAEFSSFLYLSSTRVYSRSVDTSEDGVLSVCPADLSDIYNISKLAGEAVCLASLRENVRVARLSNVVGPKAANTDSFIGALCREAKAGHIELETNPLSEKDYIWIDDASRLLGDIALDGKDKIYNVASGLQLSHMQWVSAMSVKLGCSFSMDENAPMSGFPLISTDRVRKEFDFTPKPVLEHISAILDA